jgi:F420H(2)-dependent quinone reductase
MADAATDGINGFNGKIIAEFRANGGRVSESLAGTPMILIHHIGAKSGIERVTPLACSPQDDGRIVIVALKWRIANPPKLVLQPQGQPQDRSRGRHRNVHGAGGRAGRHRPRRAVAEADRGVIRGFCLGGEAVAAPRRRVAGAPVAMRETRRRRASPVDAACYAPRDLARLVPAQVVFVLTKAVGSSAPCRTGTCGMPRRGRS